MAKNGNGNGNGNDKDKVVPDPTPAPAPASTLTPSPARVEGAPLLDPEAPVPVLPPESPAAGLPRYEEKSGTGTLPTPDPRDPFIPPPSLVAGDTGRPTTRELMGQPPLPKGGGQ